MRRIEYTQVEVDGTPEAVLAACKVQGVDGWLLCDRVEMVREIGGINTASATARPRQYYQILTFQRPEPSTY